MISRSSLYRTLCLIVALNYFAFRVEPFEEEDAQNSPAFHTGVSLSLPTLNWETFDKDNAPVAFVFDAETGIDLLGTSIQPPPISFEFFPPFRLIQDKSPPGTSRVSS